MIKFKVAHMYFHCREHAYLALRSQVYIEKKRKISDFSRWKGREERMGSRVGREDTKRKEMRCSRVRREKN